MYQKYVIALKSDFNNHKIINSIPIFIKNPITIMERRALVQSQQTLGEK